MSASLQGPQVLDELVHYLVDAPEGAVGILDGWIRDDCGRPTGLVVAHGWFGRRRFELPIAKLAAVDHAHRRVVLAGGAAPPGPRGVLQRLMELGQPRTRADRSAEALTWPAQAAVEQVDQPERACSGPVLCLVADDADAANVVATAAMLANAVRAPLVLTHVTASGAGEEEREAAPLIGAMLSAAAAGANVRRLVVRGATAPTLAELARRENASFLVAGSGRGTTLSEVFTGSASDQAAGRTPCPVVLVPRTHQVALPDDERASLRERC